MPSKYFLSYSRVQQQTKGKYVVLTQWQTHQGSSNTQACYSTSVLTHCALDEYSDYSGMLSTRTFCIASLSETKSIW